MNAQEPRLLLHVCCAPCAVHLFRELSENARVTGYFYNPNIQPAAEYQFRRSEALRVAEMENWDLVSGSYDPGEWDRSVRGLEQEPERGRRCPVCFEFRLRRAFLYAEENGFDQVATSLSISPHKLVTQINACGEKLSREFGIEFLNRDFKKKDGFKKTRILAASLNIRAQNYCGCLYSRRESP
jgi:predicted adenine nucleotide alpha hydrolase (AANH) superfamily ATPase